MAFFCPMFPKRGAASADYESYDNIAPTTDLTFDTNTKPRLYPTRSLGALNQDLTEDNDTCCQDLSKFPPYTAVKITADFHPTVDDELEVKKGEFVTALYREEDWIFVIRSDKAEGFIPAMYCRLEINKIPTFSHNGISKKKRGGSLRKTFGALLKHRSKSQDLRHLQSINEDNDLLPSPVKPKTVQSPKAAENVGKFLESLERRVNANSSDIVTPKINDNSKLKETNDIDVSIQFTKEPAGQYVVSYDFTGRVADDLSVRKGQILTVLNREDNEWLWVRNNEDEKEGFVPSSYITPIQKDNDSLVSSSCSSEGVSGDTKGSELVVTCDFVAVGHDDLCLRKGDWIYSKQNVKLAPGGWLWAYCPRTRKCGFVPSQYVRVPIATVL